MSVPVPPSPPFDAGLSATIEILCPCKNILYALSIAPTPVPLLSTSIPLAAPPKSLATRIIPSRAVSCAAKSLSILNANTIPTVCCTRSAAQALKASGKFTRITWDEALTEIATRLTAIASEEGPEAVLPYSYAGTMGQLNYGSMDRRFFHRLGASRLDRTICSATGGLAITQSQGARFGMEPEQFANAKLIIAWGANILGTNSHLWPFIVEARRKGAKFYVIDPVKNRTGHAADKHYPVNPGSDLALALGLAHIILRDKLEDRAYIESYTNGFSELAALAANYPPEKVSQLSGLAQSDIELLAHEYATTQPSALRVNYGVQRSDRGGSAVRAISALPVLTGAWRHAGGGLQLTTSGAFEFNSNALERPDLQKLSPLGREARLINMSLLGQALVDLDQPRVRALVVYNSNPAAIAPNQTKVSKDSSATIYSPSCSNNSKPIQPTTPTSSSPPPHSSSTQTYIERTATTTSNSPDPPCSAPGETKTNVEIFRLLAKRMGFTDPCFDDTEDANASKPCSIPTRHSSPASRSNVLIANVPFASIFHPPVNRSCHSPKAASAPFR